jgi:DNA-binding transcriptional ArsR family regulator
MPRADAIFGALADPMRRQVLSLVVERGPVSATALGHTLPVSRQAVVKHLTVLRNAGLVAAQRQGQEVHYELRSEALTEASEWIAQLSARWDARLARLTSYLLSEKLGGT